MTLGIANRSIRETPIAIIDFETTGLTPGADRVVEVAVVRIDPRGEPRIVLDTLVNPMRRVAATEIHGITDSDVVGAPRFSDIAGELVGALNGCVVAAYNVYFDIKFLNSELFSAGVDHEPPHFCLMYLRPMLGLGSRCKLEVACQEHGIGYQPTHMAAHDALAAASLLSHYLHEADSRGVRSFAELGRLKSYKFVESFEQDPLPHPSKFGLGSWNLLRSRSGQAKPADADPERVAIAAYWDTLKTVIADLDVTEEEAAYVASERQRLGLSADQIRSLHARVYASVIQSFTADRRIDDTEVRRLSRLHQCLSQLGWAPGERSSGVAPKDVSASLNPPQLGSTSNVSAAPTVNQPSSDVWPPAMRPNQGEKHPALVAPSRDSGQPALLATERQKEYARELGITFSSDITRSKISRLIDEAVTSSNENRDKTLNELSHRESDAWHQMREKILAEIDAEDCRLSKAEPSQMVQALSEERDLASILLTMPWGKIKDFEDLRGVTIDISFGDDISLEEVEAVIMQAAKEIMARKGMYAVSLQSIEDLNRELEGLKKQLANRNQR